VKKADTSEGYGMLSQEFRGYKMPADGLNMVQFTQTSPLNLIPTTLACSNRNYLAFIYTTWNYGGP